MEIYYVMGNKEKVMVLFVRLCKVIGNKGSYFQYLLLGLFFFYKKNELIQNYQEMFLIYVMQVDKIFNFVFLLCIEMELIDLLSKFDDVVLMNKCIDLLMSVLEYICYDDRYCYEYKIKVLKNFFQYKQNVVVEKYIVIFFVEV